jgi:hypothetical protein
VKRTTKSNDVEEPQDPVLAILARVPIDDEPLTADEERAIVEGWAAYHRGEAEPAADAQEKQGAPV